MQNPLQKFFYYRPFADRTLCHFLKKRLLLPEISLQTLWEEFDQHPVVLHQLPKGSWSTPLADVAIILKIVVCHHPKKLLEVGSFRGYTALYLAQHIATDARIVTVDLDPQHGEAYQNTRYADQIDRRIGKTSSALFQQDEPGSYDFIFVDADHTYDGVKYDTELLLPLLSPTGFFLWHDYANWGYFDGKNGVPEYLNELSKMLPIAHISGSDLAIYSPAWSGDQQAKYQNALLPKISPTQIDPWSTATLRG
jgi:Methyltransferase domain